MHLYLQYLASSYIWGELGLNAQIPCLCLPTNYKSVIANQWHAGVQKEDRKSFATSNSVLELEGKALSGTFECVVLFTFSTFQWSEPCLEANKPALLNPMNSKNRQSSKGGFKLLKRGTFRDYIRLFTVPWLLANIYRGGTSQVDCGRCCVFHSCPRHSIRRQSADPPVVITTMFLH